MDYETKEEFIAAMSSDAAAARELNFTPEQIARWIFKQDIIDFQKSAKEIYRVSYRSFKRSRMGDQYIGVGRSPLDAIKHAMSGGISGEAMYNFEWEEIRKKFPDGLYLG